MAGTCASCSCAADKTRLECSCLCSEGPKATPRCAAIAFNPSFLGVALPRAFAAATSSPNFSSCGYELRTWGISIASTNRAYFILARILPSLGVALRLDGSPKVGGCGTDSTCRECSFTRAGFKGVPKCAAIACTASLLGVLLPRAFAAAMSSPNIFSFVLRVCDFGLSIAATNRAYLILVRITSRLGDPESPKRASRLGVLLGCFPWDRDSTRESLLGVRLSTSPRGDVSESVARGLSLARHKLPKVAVQRRMARTHLRII